MNRYDFVLVFDVKDGNPNGDPDAGNIPRVDPETGHGLVTDVCIKRKIRNFVSLTKGEDAEGYLIFIKEKAILNRVLVSKFTELGIDIESPPKDATDGKKRKEKGKAQGEEVERARDAMCRGYFDVRTFGAVMSSGPNAGQVRGPVQLTFARSVDPIVTLEHLITRVAVATEKEAEAQGGDNRTFGRKATVPYGLYVAYGFVSPGLAAKTGFSDEDLELVFNALERMFEFDRSAARGLMSTRALIIFEHTSPLGDAPAFRLFDRVQIRRTNLVTPPRSYSDYSVTIDGETGLKQQTGLKDTVRHKRWA